MMPPNLATAAKLTASKSKLSSALLTAFVLVAGASFAISMEPPSQNALHFDGANDLVNATPPEFFTNIASNDFTIEAWVKPETTVFSRILFV